MAHTATKQEHRVTFDYAIDLPIFDGRCDREILCEGTYSVNLNGSDTDWRIETCDKRLNQWDWYSLEDAVAELIASDLADWYSVNSPTSGEDNTVPLVSV